MTTPTPPRERGQGGAPVPARRPPTAAEARALGHPTRLRIVFACRDRAMTNKELAEALGTTPGTIHYHLRPLIAEGFLRAEEPRPGPRGSTEQPYRSTGKSWQVGGDARSGGVLRQIAAEELLHASDEDSLTLTRLGATLPRSVLEEVLGRLGAILEEVKASSVDAGEDTESVTFVLGVQRQPRPPA